MRTDIGERAPVLAEALTTPQELAQLAEALLAWLDERGRLVDAASVELGRLRQAVERIRQELVRCLQRLIRRHAEVLREAVFVEREGRYTLPVRSGRALSYRRGRSGV